MKTNPNTQSDPAQVAQLQVFASLNRLIEAAEAAKKDRDELFRTLREQRKPQEPAQCH